MSHSPPNLGYLPVCPSAELKILYRIKGSRKKRKLSHTFSQSVSVTWTPPISANYTQRERSIFYVISTHVTVNGNFPRWVRNITYMAARGSNRKFHFALLVLQASLDLQYTEDEIYELSLAREPRGSSSTVRSFASSSVFYEIRLPGWLRVIHHGTFSLKSYPSSILCQTIQCLEYQISIVIILSDLTERKEALTVGHSCKNDIVTNVTGTIFYQYKLRKRKI